MNRQKLLILFVSVLVLGNVAYRVWANWGLVTVHATEADLSTVIRTVAKQGGVKIETNLEPDRKVTMHVDKVPLSYALEVLANVSDARWELGYFLAPAKGDIATALGQLANGDRLEGWQRFHVPLPPGGMPGGEDQGTSDPRQDRWEVKPAPEATLVAYLEQAAKNVSARLTAPKDWNPAVGSAPKGGELEDVMPRLAKAAGGAVQEVFLLTGRRRSEVAENSGPPDGGDGPGRRFGALAGGAPTADQEAEMRKRMEAMAERMQAEINKLPEKDRTAAQKEFDERKAFFENMRNLTPEERRAKVEERMSDPAEQERMMSGMAKREAMKTPQQRSERYRDYVQRKQGAQ